MVLSMPLVAAAVVVLLCVGVIIFLTFTGRRPDVSDRIEQISNSRRSGFGSAGFGSAGQDTRGSTRGISRSGNSERAQLSDRIMQAGFYNKRSAVMYHIMRVVLMLIPVVAGVVAANLGYVSTSLGLIYGLLAAALGTIVPSFWLDYKKGKRQMKIRRALPDALDVIIVCVEAGLSLPAALNRVAKELRGAHPMLAGEISICQREIQLGASTGEALRRFGQRFDLEEVRSLASVVQQAEKYGASIAHALRVHADTLRLKRFQRAEEKAQQAVVKLVFPTILCIFPALFIVLAGPAIFRIFEMFDRMAG